MCNNINKKIDYLVLVNGENRLPENFEESLELIDVENGDGNLCKVEKKTYEAFLKLQEDVLKSDGIQAKLIGAYRTVKTQEEMFEARRAAFGIENAKKYVAKPGHSEHHTGIAIDVGIFMDGKLYRTIDDLLKVESLLKIIQKKAVEYGFILRYPKGKESVTKINYEPWHFRYIDSPEIAKEITEKGICFEEYL